MIADLGSGADQIRRMLPIHEQFYTFQGEGVHLGKAAYFVRTIGCPIHCPWCDSAGTWHPDYLPKKINRIDESEIVAAVAATSAEFVVVTGGEPTIHDLSPLVKALHAIGRSVHLETSGAFPIEVPFDWITVSPKRWKPPLTSSVEKADEFKIIVDSDTAIEEGIAMIEVANRPVWLHPEWSQHTDTQRTNQITDWIKQHGAPFRAGWQLHKNFRADQRDERSASASPLGGDPTKGF